VSLTREEASDLIASRKAAKAERHSALKAFGFEDDPVSGKPISPPRIVNERILHMDRITAKLRTDIPGFLKKYLNFPDEEYPEPGGVVPHVTTLLEEMFEGGYLLGLFATDHAKSITADKFFPILSLAENPDESHILMCANFADARRRVQVVERELEGNAELIRDFPWLKKPERPKGGGSGNVQWSRLEFTVSGRSANRPDPSMCAETVGSSSIRQRRGKLIMDDIEGARNSKYALTRQELYDFIKLEASRCYEGLTESKRPLQAALGTPFDPDSLYLRLEGEDWRVIRVPAYTVPWDKISQSAIQTTKHGDTFETDWKIRASRLPDSYFTWARQRYKVTEADPHFGKKRTRAQFSLTHLLDPTEGKPGRLSLKQLEDLIRDKPQQGGNADPNAAEFATFVTLDPASGVNTRFADYAGIAVVKIRWPRSEKLPEVQVIEAYKFEQGVIEQVDFIADLTAKYQCPLIYEANSQQRGTYTNAFGHYQPSVKLIPVWTTEGNKFDTEMGLTIIKTLIQTERLKVPLSQIDSEGIQSMLSEVRELGGATDRHDHICCAVWFVCKWLYEQIRYLSPDNAAPSTMTRRFGSSTGGFFRSHPAQRSWKSWQRR
jgi:hypothetical protein